MENEKTIKEWNNKNYPYKIIDCRANTIKNIICIIIFVISISILLLMVYNNKLKSDISINLTYNSTCNPINFIPECPKCPSSVCEVDCPDFPDKFEIKLTNSS